MYIFLIYAFVITFSLLFIVESVAQEKVTDRFSKKPNFWLNDHWVAQGISCWLHQIWFIRTAKRSCFKFHVPKIHLNWYNHFYTGIHINILPPMVLLSTYCNRKQDSKEVFELQRSHTVQYMRSLVTAHKPVCNWLCITLVIYYSDSTPPSHIQYSIFVKEMYIHLEMICHAQLHCITPI